MNYILKGLRRPVSKKVAVDPGPHGATGFAYRVIGYETFDVELVIDLDGIARDLGQRAGNNKSNKAIGLSGLVKAYARNRKREVGA
jgi:hypothetical protein